MKVEKALLAVHDPAVLDLEGDAASDVQALAVPLRGLVMNAYHAAILALEQLLQGSLEGPVRLPAVAPELGERRVATPRGVTRTCGRATPFPC